MGNYQQLMNLPPPKKPHTHKQTQLQTNKKQNNKKQ